MTDTPIITNWPPKLRRADAARYLREVHGIPVQPSTMAKWHSQKSDGPPAHHAGRVPLYPRDALDAWAAKRLGPLRASTSDRQAAYRIGKRDMTANQTAARAGTPSGDGKSAGFEGRENTNTTLVAQTLRLARDGFHVLPRRDDEAPAVVTEMVRYDR